MKYFKIKNCGINPKTKEQEYTVTEYKRLFGRNYDYVTYVHHYTRNEIFDMLVLVNKSKIEFT